MPLKKHYHLLTILFLVSLISLEACAQDKDPHSIVQICRNLFSPKAILKRFALRASDVFADKNTPMNLQNQILSLSSSEERGALLVRLNAIKKIKAQPLLTIRDFKRLAELNNEVLAIAQRLLAKQGVLSQVIEGDSVIEPKPDFQQHEESIAKYEGKIAGYKADIERQERRIEQLENQGISTVSTRSYLSSIKDWLARDEQELLVATRELSSAQSKHAEKLALAQKEYLDFTGQGKLEDEQTYTFLGFLGQNSELANRHARYSRKLEIISVPEKYHEAWKIKYVYKQRILYSPNTLHSLSAKAGVSFATAIFFVPELIPLVPFDLLKYLDTFAHEGRHIDFTHQRDQRIENPYQIHAGSSIWSSLGQSKKKFIYSRFMSFEEQFAYGESRAEAEAGNLFELESKDHLIAILGPYETGRDRAEMEQEVAELASQILDLIDLAIDDPLNVHFEIEGLNDHTGPSQAHIVLKRRVLSVDQMVTVDLVRLNATNEASRFDILRNFLDLARKANREHLRASKAYLETHPKIPIDWVPVRKW